MSEAGADGWHHFGAHRWRREAARFVHFSVTGDISESDIHVIYGMLLRMGKEPGDGPVVVLLDVTRMGAILPAARKAVVSPEYRYQRLVPLFVGASFAQRAVLKLIDTAYRLVSRDQDATPHRFFGTVAEAQAWVAQRSDGPQLRGDAGAQGQP